MKTDIAPTEIDCWRGGVVQGEVHDESAWALNRPVGSAGLFSTVPDLLTFLCMLLNRGTWKGVRFFSEESIQAMGTNQIAHIGSCTGLGWELNQPRYMGKNCSDWCIGKTGFTGCVFLCDLDKGMGMVLLSNSTFPQRNNNQEAINSVRRDVADIVFV
jgi:CubicO group peptidase (beta-lactamase class C family)